jgi:hypothetical protein
MIIGLPAPGPVVGLASPIAALALYRRWRPFHDEALAASELGKGGDRPSRGARIRRRARSHGSGTPG